jgi:hypothetical protein
LRLLCGLYFGLLLLGMSGIWGCGLRTAPPSPKVADCFREASRAIANKPDRDCLPTLDQNCVPLQIFYDRCAALWPDCVLFPKFYHWPSRIEDRISRTPSGAVAHKIRVYFNLLSTCDPDHVDPGRTHGDVAEFYDSQGRFMGLAVYMGQGLYVPLPFEE